MLEAFAGLSTPLVAGACVRCGVPLRAAPAGIGAVVATARSGAHLASSGDIVFADDDGVVFVPAGQAGPVPAAARQIGETEQDQAHRTGEGQTLRQQTAFDDYLAQRAADPSCTFRQHLRRTGGAIEE